MSIDTHTTTEHCFEVMIIFVMWIAFTNQSYNDPRCAVGSQNGILSSMNCNEGVVSSNPSLTTYFHRDHSLPTADSSRTVISYSPKV